MTPIMWDVNILNSHPWVIRLFKLNPMYYVVTGYRDSMLGHVGIWNHLSWTVYFLATSSRQNLRQRHFTLAFPGDFRFIPL